MQVDFSDTKSLMEKTLQHFKGEISTIRTGRAVPALIENIPVEAYGGTTRLTIKELGTITAPDPQTLVIQPWDKSVIGEIRQGILAANVGLTPVIDGGIIRLAVPPLTTERRQEYVKLLRQKMEEARIAIRNIRQDKLKEIKEAFEEKRLSEDERFRAEEDLQKITDEFIAQVESLGKKKEEEIVSI